MTETLQATRPHRHVPTRRISFEELFADLPKYYAGDGDLFMSHMMSVLSAVFPDGEDFFVRSVRHYRDQITDPELKKDVAGFIGQEATHGRQHRALNDRLAELGYPTKRIERFTRWGLKNRERIMSAESNLAATAALEHFTATMAEILLSDEGAREAVGDSVVGELLLWHAIEECEHKAVAFDVYRAIGGSERTRVWTMNFIMVSFFVGMNVDAAISMLRDRETYQRGRLRESMARLRRSPFLRAELVGRLRDYNRRDFHPDDRDTDALLEEWRDRLFGAEGRLSHLVANAA